MKTGTLIGIVLLAAATVAGGVWMFRSQTPEVISPTPASKVDAKDDKTASKSPTEGKAAEKSGEDGQCPPLPEPGQPTPQIVAAETEFLFGSMEALQEKSHAFVVRNTGKADLLIKQGRPPTCKCTLSKMAEKPIPPGGSAEVVLTWKPITRQKDWNQSAEICTNDPQRRRITFVIKGDVVERVSLVPGEMWQLGEVVEGTPSVIHGRIYSMTLDKFEIKKIVFPNTKLLKGTWTPLPEAELKQYNAKTGYLIRMETQPGLPAGSFTFDAELQTDIPEDLVGGGNGPPLTMKVKVGGTRSGPLVFGPGSGSTGATFRPDHQVVAMGRIEAIKGKRGTLSMFVRNCPPEGLKILEQKCEECPSKPLKVTLEEDKSFKEKARRYLLHIDYPKGADKNPRDESGNTGCRVRLKTNHPEAKDFDLMIYYQWY